jgi:hypothetical protein
MRSPRGLRCAQPTLRLPRLHAAPTSLSPSRKGRGKKAQCKFVPAARMRPSFAKSQTRIRTKAPKPRSKALPKTALQQREAERRQAHPTGNRIATDKFTPSAQTGRRAARAFAPFSPANRRGSRRGRARLSALHCGTRRGLASTRLRAALPGIAGCKREDPPRRQCSEHLADRQQGRTVDARYRPGAQCMAASPGTALAPPQGVPSRRRPEERDGHLRNRNGD